MSKWYGKVGFATTVEYEAGCWEEMLTVRPYYGDVLSNKWKKQNSGGVNDDINLSNQISIVADSFAFENCSAMTFIEYSGAFWKITDVEVQFPRLLINVGGVYHGDTTGTSV